MTGRSDIFLIYVNTYKIYRRKDAQIKVQKVKISINLLFNLIKSVYNALLNLNIQIIIFYLLS